MDGGKKGGKNKGKDKKKKKDEEDEDFETGVQLPSKAIDEEVVEVKKKKEKTRGDANTESPLHQKGGSKAQDADDEADSLNSKPSKNKSKDKKKKKVDDEEDEVSVPPKEKKSGGGDDEVESLTSKSSGQGGKNKGKDKKKKKVDDDDDEVSQKGGDEEEPSKSTGKGKAAGKKKGKGKKKGDDSDDDFPDTGVPLPKVNLEGGEEEGDEEKVPVPAAGKKSWQKEEREKEGG